jgi:putative membrane protein
MKKLPLLKHYNWKIILIRILVSAFAIGLVALLIPQIYFTKITLMNLLIIGLALGILNALVKPALMFLTAQLFFATFGLLILLINAFLLYLLDWIFPSIFVVQSLLWALIGGALLGLVSNSLENLFGVYPPIVPTEDEALRQRIKAQAISPLQNLVSGSTRLVSPTVETQSLADVQAAQAALELINGKTSPPESPPVDPPDFESSDINESSEEARGEA